MKNTKTIAIDTQTALAEKTGFGFYVSNLVRELKNIEPDFNYAMLLPQKRNKDFAVWQRFLWDQFEFPIKAAQAHADLIHQPGFSVPILTTAKVVVTVHDLIPRLFGNDIPFWSRNYFATWMPFTYRRANHIIADSEHTKRDIIRELGVPEEKITVIYLAVAEEYFAKASKEHIEKVRDQFGLKHPYFVHIGTLEPRKNLPFLVKAFADVVKKEPNTQLVIAGKKGWYYEELFKLVKERQLEDKVIFTGYLPDEDKPALLQGATALTFPSVYEGFGLPPLEALAASTPVISSNSSSLPEVVGDSGLMVDPTDQVGWTKAMLELRANSKLAQELSIKGIKQARKFSWRKCAEQTVEIYKKVLNEK